MLNPQEPEVFFFFFLPTIFQRKSKEGHFTVHKNRFWANIKVSNQQADYIICSYDCELDHYFTMAHYIGLYLAYTTLHCLNQQIILWTVTGYIRHLVYRRHLRLNQYLQSDWLMDLRFKRSDIFQQIRSRMQFTPDSHQKTRWQMYAVTVLRAILWIYPIYCCINDP